MPVIYRCRLLVTPGCAQDEPGTEPGTQQVPSTCVSPEEGLAWSLLPPRHIGVM